jgi:ribosomal protein S18 acetylase RimI-like enzyme
LGNRKGFPQMSNKWNHLQYMADPITPISLIVREATLADIPKLAHLHVVTWNATYPEEPHKPTYQIREYQWQQAFEVKDESWFCFVIENPKNELVGFAKGKREKDGSGNLNKIYLLDKYKRQGLGRLLVGYVARRFLNMAISSMSVIEDAQNPSCAFYERLGAKEVRSKDPSIGVYLWRDLNTLASYHPIK